MSQQCHTDAPPNRPSVAALLQWRGRIMANSNEWQRRNAALAKEKEIVLGHHTALKGALAKFRQAQEARLKQMCVA